MKPWYTSKTIWVNILTLAIAILTITAESSLLSENRELVLAITTVLVPSLNVFLRWLTVQPITSVTQPMDKIRSGILKGHRQRIKDSL